MQVKKTLRILLGLILAICGIAVMLVGAYLLWKEQTLAMFGLCVLFISFGFLIGYLGYDLMRGRSIKDDLFFLFFN